MEPGEIEAAFAGPDGYRFARWGRPVAPVVFGVEEETLRVVKGAIEAVAQLTGQEVAGTDPELGSNLMFFFFRDWSELPGVPGLGEMLPGLEELVTRLDREGASQYRVFRFDEAGAIRAAFVFLRMGGALSEMPAETLALAQVVQVALLWGDGAFAARSPLAVAPGGAVILRPEVAALLRAAYDPVLPAATQDPSHALRLFARMQAGAAQQGEG